MAYKTPGVYTEEISLLPPSVAEVETALPAIVGYTARADRRGVDLTNVPTRIGSMLEYRELFGGPPTPALDTVTVSAANVVERVRFDDGGHYFTYNAVRHFFDNGGGDCYIVSVGRFDDPNGVELDKLTDGMAAVEKVDEPTILIAPDACIAGEDTAAPGAVDNAAFYAFQQATLQQCVRLGDRVAVFDLKENTAPGAGPADERAAAAAVEFRDKIGINGLKYGAAYTPWLVTTYPTDVPFALFDGKVQLDDTTPVELDALSPDPAVNALVTRARAAVADAGTLATAVLTIQDGEDTLEDRYLRARNAFRAVIDDGASDDDDRKTALVAYATDLRGLVNDLATYATGTAEGVELQRAIAAYAGPVATRLIALEKHASYQSATNPGADPGIIPGDADGHYGASALAGFATPAAVAAYVPPPDRPLTGLPTVAARVEAFGDVFDEIVGGENGLLAVFDSVAEAAASEIDVAEDALYAGHPTIDNIRAAIARELATVPPSAAVAGVYAYVDRTRGVHKAPANVSLAYVAGPTALISAATQENLNVDVVAGKSINAIRPFAGRGTLVWGARTLAGNDNEWRYVPVRRLYNVVEESVKKSTAWAVFEPNDANLWVKVKGMIDNYLTTKWQEGALAGASPAEAFYVAIGLGQTMTPQDVLEGRLIVEIGMAAVRPAEFIILRFSHLLQQS